MFGSPSSQSPPWATKPAGATQSCTVKFGSPKPSPSPSKKKVLDAGPSTSIVKSPPGWLASFCATWTRIVSPATTSIVIDEPGVQSSPPWSLQLAFVGSSCWASFSSGQAECAERTVSVAPQVLIVTLPVAQAVNEYQTSFQVKKLAQLGAPPGPFGSEVAPSSVPCWALAGPASRFAAPVQSSLAGVAFIATFSAKGDCWPNLHITRILYFLPATALKRTPLVPGEKFTLSLAVTALSVPQSPSNTKSFVLHWLPPVSIS